MKIAILGYGKMGHEIEAIALVRGHEIILRASAHEPFKASDLAGADIAIEFTRPDAASDNILKCLEAHCPVVTGTTGWYMRLPEIREQVLAGQGSLLYSSNFSVGVNVLFHLNRELARIMNGLQGYEPAITEIHHAAKLDKPSGTALTLAEGVLEEFTGKKSWINEAVGAADELPIISVREGSVPGTHEICYTSEVDRISLRHEAFNRKGFALGAVKAAEWLKSRKGVYTMNDFLTF